jgi:hypothetical protein
MQNIFTDFGRGSAFSADFYCRVFLLKMLFVAGGAQKAY